MSETDTAAAEIADFWFDPLCPWAWLTSRWMLEVEKVRPVKTQFHVMSLAVLNSGRDLGEKYNKLMQQAWGPVRLCMAAAVRQREGGEGVDSRSESEVLRDLYTALGTRFHNKQMDKDVATYEEALTEAGLPTSLVSALDDTQFDDEIRASHQVGIDKVGQEVGTPVISVAGTAFFGPVITPAPKGDAAAKLWDGVLAVAQTPGFFELKRTRDQPPIFD
jgi:2-hydroxychromene-2-carboxylate isomerase